MSFYVFMSLYAFICFYMLSLCWISLNIPENDWLNIASDIKYTSVLNILGYSYNNIINIANVIILEFLFARFVHPSDLQLAILSFLTQVRTSE